MVPKNRLPRCGWSGGPNYWVPALYSLLGYPTVITRATLVALSVNDPPAIQETQVWSLVGKMPWRRKWLPTPLFLPGKPHGQRNLAGYSPCGCRDLETTEWLSTCYCNPGSGLGLTFPPTVVIIASRIIHPPTHTPTHLSSFSFIFFLSYN